MIEYNVTAAAEELMLDTSDLQEVYELFFDEAKDLLAVCRQAVREQNYMSLGKPLHNLKGIASNLRMQEITALAVKLEELGATGKGEQIESYLLELQNKIDDMQEYVHNFYVR